jgi:hypothetical protein
VLEPQSVLFHQARSASASVIPIINNDTAYSAFHWCSIGEFHKAYTTPQAPMTISDIGICSSKKAVCVWADDRQDCPETILRLSQAAKQLDLHRCTGRMRALEMLELKRCVSRHWQGSCKLSSCTSLAACLWLKVCCSRHLLIVLVGKLKCFACLAVTNGWQPMRGFE